MPLYASGVTIPADLSGALSGVGTGPYNKIKQNSATAQGQFGADAAERGMNGAKAIAPGSYAGTQFPTKQALDIGSLESALGGGLANTGYQNQLQERGFQQDEDLAREVAAMNKPDLLQQILGGAGNVGGTAAHIYGAWGRNKMPQVGATGGELPAASSYIPGGSPSAYYRNPNSW